MCLTTTVLKHHIFCLIKIYVTHKQSVNTSHLKHSSIQDKNCTAGNVDELSNYE